MSGKVVGWAAEQRTGSPVTKLVLFKLADNANDDGIAWPSVALMVQHTELSEASVRGHLKKLEELGLIRRQPRRGDDGEQTSNLYHLNVPWPSSAIARRAPRKTPVQEVEGVGPVARGGPVQQVEGAGPADGPKPSLEPSGEPIERENARAREGDLEQFMKAGRWHPSSNLDDVQAELSAVGDAPPFDVLIASAKAYHARNVNGRGSDPAFSVSAHTFIRKRMWRDHPVGAATPAKADDRAVPTPAWKGYEHIAKRLRDPSPGEFDAWLGKCALIEVMDDEVVFEATKKVVRDYVQTRWSRRIEREFEQELGKKVVTVTVRLAAPLAPWVGD